MPTLATVLSTQDMGANHIEKICEQVLSNNFDANTDPITAIIVNAFQSNEYGTNPDGFCIDLNYAINALRKAQITIKLG